MHTGWETRTHPADKQTHVCHVAGVTSRISSVWNNKLLQPHSHTGCEGKPWTRWGLQKLKRSNHRSRAQRSFSRFLKCFHKFVWSERVHKLDVKCPQPRNKHFPAWIYFNFALRSQWRKNEGLFLNENSGIIKPRPYFWHEIRLSTHREQFGVHWELFR